MSGVTLGQLQPYFEVRLFVKQRGMNACKGNRKEEAMKRFIKRLLINFIGISLAFLLINYVENGAKFEFSMSSLPVILIIVLVISLISTFFDNE